MAYLSEELIRYEKVFPCAYYTFTILERRWKALLSEDNVWGSFGVHPKYAEQWSAETEATLRDAVRHYKVKAVGEIGLDYSKGQVDNVISYC